MLKIGTHLSSAKGYFQMGKDALSIGANTFQFFSRNPRGTKVKKMDYTDMEKLKELMRENGMAQIVVHAPYTMNACSSDPHLRELAGEMIAEDLERLEAMPGQLYNFHPGSHTGQGAETAIGQISQMLNGILSPRLHTKVLLETMSGKGTEVGKSFKELKDILDRVECRDKMGVCMDACHLYSAGYDIVNHLEEVLKEFDDVIGLEHLYAFHINDSFNPFASNKDHHAKLGEGTIGYEAIVRLVTHPRLRKLPFILETPLDLAGHKEEIKTLREACRI